VSDHVAGLVLAGGLSSRFGSPKSEAILEGATLLEHVLTTMREPCSRVAVVLAPEQEVPISVRGTDITIVRDATTHDGPLAGLLAGLGAIGEGWTFVASCDAPLLRAELLQLLAERRTPGAQVVFAEVGGVRQPLPCLVSVEALPALRAVFEAGERRIRRALAGVPFVTVPEAEVRHADPDLLSFRNVNTRDDLRALEADLRRRT